MTLAVPVHHALETVERSLTSLHRFDPATSTRRYRIGVNDIVNPVLVPALVGIVRDAAPGVVLEFVQQPAGGPQDMLLRGDLDTGIVLEQGISEGLCSQPAWAESLVIVVGERNPIARHNMLPLEAVNSLRFATQSHAPVLTKLVDDLFAKAGAPRKNVCCVSDEQSLYTFVTTSDLATVGGRKFADLNNRDNRLVLFDPPFDLPRLQVHLAWSQASKDDEGHTWIRDHILGILQDAFRMLDTAEE